VFYEQINYYFYKGNSNKRRDDKRTNYTDGTIKYYKSALITVQTNSLIAITTATVVTLVYKLTYALQDRMRVLYVVVVSVDDWFIEA